MPFSAIDKPIILWEQDTGVFLVARSIWKLAKFPVHSVVSPTTQKTELSWTCVNGKRNCQVSVPKMSESFEGVSSVHLMDMLTSRQKKKRQHVEMETWHYVKIMHQHDWAPPSQNVIAQAICCAQVRPE